MNRFALVPVALLIAATTACVPLPTFGRAQPPTATPEPPVPTATARVAAPSPTGTRPAATATHPAATATRTATTSPAASPTRPPATPSASPAVSAPTATRPAVTIPVVAAPAPNDLLFPVDRDRALPASYVPPDLVPVEGVARTVRGSHLVRQVVIDDLARMIRDMQAAGLNPVISSAYRSYAVQEATYAYWVQTLGAAQADRVSAKPGHSEHQLGTAIDFASAENGYELDESFATTREGRWLLANAARYGFVLSYPAGAEDITGYAYEPWHYRYVGPMHAQAIVASGRPPIEYYRAHRR